MSRDDVLLYEEMNEAYKSIVAQIEAIKEEILNNDFIHWEDKADKNPYLVKDQNGSFILAELTVVRVNLLIAMSNLRSK